MQAKTSEQPKDGDYTGLVDVNFWKRLSSNS